MAADHRGVTVSLLSNMALREGFARHLFQQGVITMEVSKNIQTFKQPTTNSITE